MEPVKMLLTAVSDAPCDIKTWSWKERIWRQLGGQRKATDTIPVTQAERSWLGEQMFIQHLTLPLSTISLSLTHTHACIITHGLGHPANPLLTQA